LKIFFALAPTCQKSAANGGRRYSTTPFGLRGTPRSVPTPSCGRLTEVSAQRWASESANSATHVARHSRPRKLFSDTRGLGEPGGRTGSTPQLASRRLRKLFSDTRRLGGWTLRDGAHLSPRRRRASAYRTRGADDRRVHDGGSPASLAHTHPRRRRASAHRT